MMMIATRQMDVRANIKKYFDIAFNGEPVIVLRKENRNVMIISESEYNELAKTKKNAEYLAMLDERMERLNNGKGIHKTMNNTFIGRRRTVALPSGLFQKNRRSESSCVRY